MNEVALGLAWIKATLLGDSTMVALAPGGFRRAMAPPGTPTPFVMFASMTGADTTTMNEVRLLSRVTYQIRAVGPVSQEAAIIALANQIDALFGDPTSGTTTGGLISACYRTSPVTLDELVNGKEWTNIGGMYLLEIQRTT